MTDQVLIRPPIASEKRAIRVMIVLGTVSTFFLLCALLKPENIGQPFLYILLMAGILYYCVRMFAEWYLYYSISIPDLPLKYSKKTVDIFTTFCAGEPYEMIVSTLTAVQNIKYPHTTYLCDEANDPYLKAECKRLGVIHVTRVDKRDAKAGNINNALKQSSGELCLILDPDHVPASDLLEYVIPYFEDPVVGFVQIVQAYRNSDASLIAKGAAQQTYHYYGPMMMGMNAYGTVQAIGANCTFRREALDSIGGHAAGLAEDMHTAMRLHANGWKSVYVPKILSRGLVPATLSAYYKQQLKWARGTFELFLTTYFNLFKKFTWRQKLHYGLTPLYYTSGIAFFFNFIVPVISLFTGTIPLKMDITQLSFLAFPVILSNFLISQFVQRWVMEEKERGFHAVGGLLQMGTWWIFIKALFYTIIRKSIPYDPTPKDGKEEGTSVLNFPNLLVALISIFAIIYGMHYDLNPYSLVMAGFAFLNVLFMLFNLYASKQRYFQKLESNIPLFSNFIKDVKSLVWLVRHYIYSIFRKIALPVLLLGFISSGWLLSQQSGYSGKSIINEESQNSRYYGIYHSIDNAKMDSATELYGKATESCLGFNILTLNLPWGKSQGSHFPFSVIERIYVNNSIPMIIWEPELVGSVKIDDELDAQTDANVFIQIVNGLFDIYIEDFFSSAKAAGKPVFIRFAPGADNPDFRYSSNRTIIPEEYVAAWKYLVNKSRKVGAGNMIWVWDPVNPDDVSQYFPGENYVDWICITTLNFRNWISPSHENSFAQLYEPFRENLAFKSGLPVMIAEFGAVAGQGDKSTWMRQAIIDMEKYPEIKAVLFEYGEDYKNAIQSCDEPGMNKFSNDRSDLKILSDQQQLKLCDFIHNPTTNSNYAWHGTSVIDTVKGVNYNKGLDWYKSKHAISRRDIEKDFTQMKSIGINTIKRIGPGIYDETIFQIAEKEGFGVFYAFWVDPQLDFSDDFTKTNQLRKDILKTVRKMKNEMTINGWTIDAAQWSNASAQYFKPELYCHQNSFLDWLMRLSKELKEEDSIRPLTIELFLSEGNESYIELIGQTLPVDAIGLCFEPGKSNVDLDKTMPFYFSHLGASSREVYISDRGRFISEWQDVHTKTHILFNGLLDHKGRRKREYFMARDAFTLSVTSIKMNQTHILKPAVETIPGIQLTYHGLDFYNDRWNRFNTQRGDKLEWYLIETDANGAARNMISLGKGSSMDVTIPENPDRFLLYLIDSDMGLSFGTFSNLKTSLTY